MTRRKSRPIGTMLTTTIAESEISGVEIEFDWHPYEGGRVYGWVANPDAEIQDNNYDEEPYHSGQKAYATINALIRLISEEKRWGAELYVYNLTDERTRYWGDYGPGYIKSSFAPPAGLWCEVPLRFSGVTCAGIAEKRGEANPFLL